MAEPRQGNESSGKARDWKGSYEKDISKTEWSGD